MALLALVVLGISFYGSSGWERLPEIPSGRRSEFYVLHESGQYKYGYDTGNGIAAKQSGDAANQVEGHYFYNTPEGKKIDLQYSAGIQGFVPNGLKNNQQPPSPSTPSENKNTLAYGSLNTDGSYKFGFKTDDQSRDESGDANNNVKGNYSYKNSAGSHDLSYVAGSETGFKPTGGSLAIPNGLPSAMNNMSPINNNPIGSNQQAPSQGSNTNTLAYGSLNPDGSYKFGFKTDDQSRDEAGDANNNVQGSYSYKNSAGSHDLSYVAGSETGFKPTGGSLSIPNGLPSATNNMSPINNNPTGSNQQAPSQGSDTNTLAYGSLNPDGSYKFGFKTDDQSRDESGDANNNVQGSYSYNNSAGSHDLSYVAGSVTGFKPTGGSLAIPNGLPSAMNNMSPINNNPTGFNQQAPSQGSNTNTLAYGSLNPDGSYKFGFKTDDQSRDESGDANNNVKGSYSYKNSAGSHDLSYVAGSETGFKPTGGSLSVPNGLPSATNNMSPINNNPTGSNQQAPSQGSNTNTLAYGSLNPDGSYKFGFKTDDQSRDESGDANNNVQGSYSYKNSAGSHDLSYVAGSETGFKPTGGSLAIPNGLPSAMNNMGPINNNPIGANQQAPSQESNTNTLAYGSLNPDGSYKFGFKADDQSRDESGDANNNVQGSYSYKNSAGSHDLSYVAGSETGFKPTGGSLAIPNGMKGIQNKISAVSNSQPISQARIGMPIQDTKFSQKFGNLVVHTYLPPSNEKHKFGYIFDTNH
ncbi:probable serine/threonine-protein kinase clkA isoform X2 [Onthophagus taurus]|uniref:probable serine/threonine-protein kinase clkA isoform X2 n=1 Tax=Onthophagus taurus TaxID=166361 RepID=UPI0039BE1338